MRYDVVVVGAGPSGAVCAAICAEAGMRTLILDRAAFPREKVCGDCLNPSAWRVLSRLGVGKRLRHLPHLALTAIRMTSPSGRSIEVPLPSGDEGEVAIKRSLLDELLVSIAIERGAEFRDSSPVTEVAEGWAIRTGSETITSDFLVAADGRNSTVARLAGIYPRTPRDRVGWQTHLPAPPALGTRVEMRFHPRGYSGLAPINETQANLCLVSRPQHAESLKAWAKAEFGLSSQHRWQTITPLSRDGIHPIDGRLLFVGDAAEVVEPFTGEGIYYALASGELAALHLIRRELWTYAQAHAQLYQGRRWINQIARFACLYPWASDLLLRFPGLARNLTFRVTSKR